MSTRISHLFVLVFAVFAVQAIGVPGRGLAFDEGGGIRGGQDDRRIEKILECLKERHEWEGATYAELLACGVARSEAQCTLDETALARDLAWALEVCIRE